MKKVILSLHDAAAQAYNEPFLSLSENDGIRNFAHLANDTKSQICLFAEDYTLFQLGTFDQTSGQIELLPTALPIAKAIELRKPDTLKNASDDKRVIDLQKALIEANEQIQNAFSKQYDYEKQILELQTKKRSLF